MINPTVPQIEIKVIARWLILLAMLTTAPNPVTAQEGGTQGVEVAAVGSCALTGGTGGISGQVTIPGGTPQQFVQMTLYSADGRSVTNTSTNAAGNYAFSGLRAGNFILRAFPAANTSYAHEWYNNQAGPLTATPIAVTDGVTTTANIQLALGTQISGQVTASDGGPLQYVRVAVYNSQGETVANDFSTDAGGNYTTSPGLPSGQYRVYFSEPSGRPYFDEYYNDQPDLDSATVINVTAPAPVTNLNATLTRGAQITGRVTHAISGLPVQAGVSVYGEGGNDFVFVDGNGYYTTTAGLRSGTYTVTFNRVFDSQNLYGSSQVVTVTAPNALTGVNGTLSPGGQITGRVTDAGGAPLSGAQAIVYGFDFGFGDSTSTNASGVYTMTGLASGSYMVWFRRTGFVDELYNDKPTFEQADRVSVIAPNVTGGIDAALAVGGSITGTVTAADTGLPVRDFTVKVYDSTGDNIINPNFSNGQYVIPNLAAGQYRLLFEPHSSGRDCGYQEEWYNDQASLEAALPITVNAGAATPNINIALARGSAILGQVVYATDAAPLKNVSVTVYDAAGRNVASGYTNFLGRYITTPALPSGAYRVRFSDYEQGNIDEYYNDKLSLSTADVVTVTAPNDVTGISAALIEGGTINGRVTAADTGAGLPYVEVKVYNAEGEVVGYADTDADGRYVVLNGLATGNYRVEFSPPSGQGPALAASSLLLRESTPLASETDPTGAEAEAEESELTLGPTLELARTLPLNVGVAEGGFGSGYLPQFYNNKRTLAEADLVSVVAPTNTNDINVVLLRGLFLPLIQR